MADDTPPQQLSLIPYTHQNGQVVLRRGDAIVVYNSDSHQLTAHHAPDQAIELVECPYCHRPWRDDVQADTNDELGRSSSATDRDRAFVNPEYFGMLAASQRPSPTGSPAPSTPIGRIVPPALRSGRSRDVSGSHNPPSDVEFLGSEPATSARQGISKSAFSPGYFHQFFREIRLLGKGGHGVVLLVEHLMDRVSLGQFACKRIPVGDDHDWLEKVLLEVKLLQKIPHKNLVAYHWVWLEDYQPSKFGPKIPCLWMLQEYCSGGDVHNYVTGPHEAEHNAAEILKEKIRRRSRADLEPPQDLRGPSKLTFDEIFSFFRDITSGLHHLHSQGYIHRDLKPSNCLLQWYGNKAKVLISDFGEVQAAGAKRHSTGATGTISYCAPEVLRENHADGTFGNFTTKSDIFSLGMIVYFMCFGRLPYNSSDDINEENEDLDELRSEITKWPGFDDETRARPDLPEKLYKYLKRLLSVDPNERPSTEEILNSIKGGVGLGDFASTFVEEHSTRVSNLDSPKHRPSPQGRKHSVIVSRPGLSSLARHISTDDVRDRSPADRRSGHQSQSHSHSRPTSPIEASVMKRPKNMEIPSPKEHSPPPQSPRLMLPPPPEHQAVSRLSSFVFPSSLLLSLRATIFLAKLLSLMLPCTPYAANAWLLYPLVGLAALEFGIPGFDSRRLLLLSGIHIVLLVLAFQHNRLCEGRAVIWDGFEDASDF